MEKDLRVALNYEQFKGLIEEFDLLNKDLVSYDIETNAKPAYSKEIRITGFSLAPDDTKGFYTVRNSLEYNMSEEDWSKIKEFMKSYLSSRTILVHNIGYEKPVSMQEFDVDIRNFEDTMLKSKISREGRRGNGLKERCQTDLGYPDWDKDLSDYIKYIDWLKVYIESEDKVGKKSEVRILRDELLNSGIDSLLELIKPLESEIVYNYKLSESEVSIGKRKSIPKKINDSYNYLSALKNIKSLLSSYYSDESEYLDIVKRVEKLIVSLIDSKYDGLISYGMVPLKLIAKYGAYDSVATMDLNNYLSKKLTEMSTDEVDCWKGYSVMKKHYELSVYMEINGLYWNEKLANEKEEWLQNNRLLAIKSMLLSGYLDDYIYNKSIDSYIEEKCSNYEFIESIIGKFKITTYRKKTAYIDESDKRWLQSDIIDLVKSKNNISKDEVVKYVKNNISQYNTIDKIDTMLGIFSPSSPKEVNEVLQTIYKSKDLIIGLCLTRIYNAWVDNSEFDINSVSNDPPSVTIYNMIKGIESYNRSIPEDDPERSKKMVSKKVIFDKFKSSICNIIDDSLYDKIKSNLSFYIKEGLNNYDKLPDFKKERVTESECIKVVIEKSILGKELKDLSKEILVNIYVNALSEMLSTISYPDPQITFLKDTYEMMGVNIEDPSSWESDFRFLYDFRLFKKSTKMITSYIEGDKVGRGTVSIVKRDNIEDAHKFLPRECGYYDRSIDNSTEMYIKNAGWHPNSTDTLRWSAGIHTVPSGTFIKGIYTSRFKGGIIICPDYSQLEIRAVCSFSNCKAMREIYEKDGDIHMNTAVSFYGREAKDISHAERRIAKSATFSILYGGGAEALATNMLNGDIDLARRMMEGFNRAYPEVRSWMDSKVDEYKKTGRISCDRVGYFLHIDPSFQAERNAINSPIQCLIGSTLIKCCDGKSYPIEDLVGRKDFYLYSYDHDKNEIVAAKAKKIFCSGEVNKLYKITLDNGEVIQTTDNHRYLLRCGDYRRADELKVGDSIMSFYTEKDKSGYENAINKDLVNSSDYLYHITSELNDSSKIDFKKNVFERSHKVVNIEVVELEAPIKVYDIEVPKYHNFALGAGIFVHNSQASMITGYVLAEFQNWLLDNNMKSKICCYVHDSFEVDVHPSEIFIVPNKLKEMMNTIPKEKFDMLTKADEVWGENIGTENKVIQKIISEDGNEGEIHIKGYVDDLDDLCNDLKEGVKSIEWTDSNPEEDYIPIESLFLFKTPINKYMGQTRLKVERVMKIVIK